MVGAVCPVADNREVRYKAGASAIDRMNLFEVILFLGVIAGGVVRSAHEKRPALNIESAIRTRHERILPSWTHAVCLGGC